MISSNEFDLKTTSIQVLNLENLWKLYFTKLSLW